MNPPGPPDDPHAELAALVRDVRTALAWRARGGAYAAPGARTARPAAASVPVREAAATPAPSAVAARAVEVAVDVDAPAGPARTLPVIREDLGECTRCKLSETRQKIVFGVGPALAPLMFIGEAPGADEDRQGEPFVGRAGELLDKMIEAMGWGRGDVYIANVLKCRPPGNRDPEPVEVAACRPFLDAQIQAVRPRIIVTLGRPAANVVLGNDAPISALRGRFHEHRGVRVMPTFHPAFLLRQPERKRDAWSDLKQVIAELERIGVAPPRPAR
ncbi:MAG: uracil-DNA glycosylase, partial [Kofleriaceae bacterium]|nr:uracil-DNA glycosylase [Kofleriaceae bacterium]